MTAVSKDKIKDSVKAFKALDSIFGDVKKNPRLSESKPPIDLGPNIKDVEVPDSIIESILEFKHADKPKSVVKQVVKEKVVETNSEDRIQNLIKKLTELLQEAKQVISEMTTVGMIGTNQKFALGVKTKNKNKFGLRLKSLRK